jgi:hypothetical protein
MKGKTSNKSAEDYYNTNIDATKSTIIIKEREKSAVCYLYLKISKGILILSDI